MNAPPPPPTLTTCSCFLRLLFAKLFLFLEIAISQLQKGIAFIGFFSGMHGALGGLVSACYPIDTLMIANMALHANEAELKTAIGSVAGYKRSRLVNNGKSCTAWVQFEDVLSAEAAMRTLQGSSTLAFDAHGLRIAFSKNSMGARGAQT